MISSYEISSKNIYYYEPEDRIQQPPESGRNWGTPVRNWGPLPLLVFHTVYIKLTELNAMCLQ
jgi:hypothetical protein